MSSYKRISAPEQEPVTTDAVMSYWRYFPQDVNVVKPLISAARERIEDFTGRSIITQKWRKTQADWDGRAIFLERTPLASVESVRYWPADGSPQTTLSAGDYLVITDSAPGYIYLKSDTSWPSVSQRPDAIEIDFTSGEDDTDNIPESLRFCVTYGVGVLKGDTKKDANTSPDITGELYNMLVPYRVGGWIA